MFKLATLTYKCISGRAPDYLASMCTGVESVEARARLRSATAGRLLLPTTDTVVGSNTLLCDVVFTTPALPSGTHCHHA